jgi:hypothetical protein
MSAITQTMNSPHFTFFRGRTGASTHSVDGIKLLKMAISSSISENILRDVRR